jgi:hypothetical protein
MQLRILHFPLYQRASPPLPACTFRRLRSTRHCRNYNDESYPSTRRTPAPYAALLRNIHASASAASSPSTSSVQGTRRRASHALPLSSFIWGTLLPSFPLMCARHSHLFLPQLVHTKKKLHFCPTHQQALPSFSTLVAIRSCTRP